MSHYVTILYKVVINGNIITAFRHLILFVLPVLCAG